MKIKLVIADGDEKYIRRLSPISRSITRISWNCICSVPKKP